MRKYITPRLETIDFVPETPIFMVNSVARNQEGNNKQLSTDTPMKPFPWSKAEEEDNCE